MRDSIFLLLQHRHDSLDQVAMHSKERVLLMAELLSSPVLASLILGVSLVLTLIIWSRFKKWQAGV